MIDHGADSPNSDGAPHIPALTVIVSFVSSFILTVEWIVLVCWFFVIGFQTNVLVDWKRERIKVSFLLAQLPYLTLDRVLTRFVDKAVCQALRCCEVLIGNFHCTLKGVGMGDFSLQ